MLTLEELQGRHLRLHRPIDGEQSAQGGGRLPISYPGTKHASEQVRVQVCVVVSFLECGGRRDEKNSLSVCSTETNAEKPEKWDFLSIY